MTEFSCIVIRSISNYTNSHKNDLQQLYAAITATGCAKELLSYLDLEELLVKDLDGRETSSIKAIDASYM